MNKNLEKVCRFLVENKIADKDLTLDFDEGILMYKDFEWDLNSKYTEVEVKDYDDEYEELVVEDCDGYKLTIDWYGHLEVATPEDKEIDSDIKALIDLFNRIYINMPKIEALINVLLLFWESMGLDELLEQLWDINNYKIKNGKVYFKDIEIELECEE